jgi:hypothetical protein
MEKFIASAVGEHSKTLVQKRNYLLRPYGEERLNYAEVLACQLRIGSGAIESLIPQVVNLRMKGKSKFWLKQNEEIMLNLRCQWIAGSWHNFCNSIYLHLFYPSSNCLIFYTYNSYLTEFSMVINTCLFAYWRKQLIPTSHKLLNASLLRMF